MEKAIIAEKIDYLSWKNSSIVASKLETECNMPCVNYCFTDTRYRFESI